MSTLTEIKEAIKSLSDNDLEEMRNWFADSNWESWDRQIGIDSSRGALDFLFQEAHAEKKSNNLKEI